jgi:general secretion pathway protein E
MNTDATHRYVGEILVRRGALAPERLEDALALARERNAPLQDVLVATRAVDEVALVRALAEEVGLPFREKLDTAAVTPELVEKVPIAFARQNRIVPIAERDGVVEVAVADPLDPFAVDDLRSVLGRNVEPVAAPPDAIEDAINRIYERKDENALAEAKEGETVEELQDLIDMTDEAPVIRWVNNLFYNAVRDRASDIHIEPGDKQVLVRYRIDGDLYPVKTAHKGFLPSIVARVKIEAGLNIAEKRLPQDGRITKKIHGRLIDVRVSTIPTSRGERIVLRLLDKEKVLLDLTDLGFDPHQLAMMEHLITRPNGIVLVTGPTGAGKTTTLYACLNKINKPDLNILTVEDPVEYELPGIGQMQIHPKIGLTFASGLRAFLRQDPDVIMVGEIRDRETAEIAINASLTGHLVLSTLHTNDAAGAVTRLVDMEVQPFLIASSLLAVLAQRLVRRLCNHCKQPYEPTDADYVSLGITRAEALALLEQIRRMDGAVLRGGDSAAGMPGPSSAPSSASGHSTPGGSIPRHRPEFDAMELGDDLEDAEPTRVGPGPGIEATVPPDVLAALTPEQREALVRAGQRPAGDPSPSRLRARLGLGDAPSGPVFYRATGCSECAGTGYRGRLGIYELLVVDEPIRRAILDNADSKTIMRIAMSRGMRSLREDGARQVLRGVTSLEDVLAATQAGDVEGEA